jgi:hypothetical protein
VSNVVVFQRPTPPEMEGTAKCIGCQHEWEAVAPLGTAQLECPSCRTMKGMWKHPFAARDGDLEFRCLCGSEALTAYQRHGKFWLRCMNCGTDQTEAVFG